MKQKAPQLAICLASWFALSDLSAQTNLVETFNPGFESSLTSWGGSGLANVSIDALNPGAGTRSAKLAASPGNNWNTLVNVTGTIPVTAGKSYLLSVSTRHNLVGGGASFALNELNASQVSTAYLWKTTSNSAVWHTEYLVLTPRTDTRYVRIYFIVNGNATSGAAWWDNCRLIEVNATSLTAATTNPFSDSTDLTNLVLDIAPLPVSTFVKSGSTISPGSMIPCVKVGTLLVGGTLAWKIVSQASGPSGTPILEDAIQVSAAGLFAWTLDLNSAASSLPVGNYLLVLEAISRDETITRNASMRFSIQ